MKFTLLVISIFIDSPTIYCWYWNVWERTLLLKSCVAGVEQMGYLIRMYVVFDLLGKFHFVSLSSYFNTNPIPTPSYQQTSRSLIVNGCPSGGGGEKMIISRLRPSLLFSELQVSHSLLPRKKLEQPGASTTAQQLWGLRTELKMVGSEIL